MTCYITNTEGDKFESHRQDIIKVKELLESLGYTPSFIKSNIMHVEILSFSKGEFDYPSVNFRIEMNEVYRDKLALKGLE